MKYAYNSSWMRVPPRLIACLGLVGWLVLALPAFAGSHSAESNLATVDTRDRLAVEGVVFTPTSASAGQTVGLSFRVRNLGNGNSGAAVARLRLSLDSTINDNDPGFVPVEVPISALAPSGTYSYSGNISVPAGLSGGAYYLGIQLFSTVAPGGVQVANSVGVAVTKLTVTGSGAPSLQVQPTEQTVPTGASTAYFEIRNGGGGSFTWSASTPSENWLHIYGMNSGMVGGKDNANGLYVNCDVNDSTVPRSDTLTLSAPGATPNSRTVTITQLGAPPAPPKVTGFEIRGGGSAPIASPQTVNVPFPVTINAMNGNVKQTGFNGRVELSNDWGSKLNLRYAELRNGTWSGSLAVDMSAFSMRLAAQAMWADQRIEGKSNPFDVQKTLSTRVKVTVFAALSDGTPVGAALVKLLPETGTTLENQTDNNGFAQFEVQSGGSFSASAEKQGYLAISKQFLVGYFPVLETLSLRRNKTGKPPVILVPGIMGSRSGTAPDGVIPLLPARYPANKDTLSLHDFAVGSIYEAVGWDTIAKLLEPYYEVFPAPWDWRVPVIKPDGSAQAWKLYVQPVINKAKESTGSAKVDIVAHSLGGLLTRAYIQSPEYAGDIGKFAMVGTPNEGSLETYYIWFGGDPKASDDASSYVDLVGLLRPTDGSLGGIYYASGHFRELTSQQLYETMMGPGVKWSKATPFERLRFFRDHVKSAGEVLPVYGNCLYYDDQTAMPFPEWTANPLYQLNRGHLDRFSNQSDLDRVNTRLFYSFSKTTRSMIKLSLPDYSGDGVYPHGTPLGEGKYENGDGTVLMKSTLMESLANRPQFSTYTRESGGGHASLVKTFATDIRDFLNEGRGLPPAPLRNAIVSSTNAVRDQLLVSLRGRCQPWILDPQFAGSGISPVTSAYSSAWASADVSVTAEFSSFDLKNPSPGIYRGTLKSLPGEWITLEAGLVLSNTTAQTNLTWIGTTNDISFLFQINLAATNALVLWSDVAAPANLRSYESNKLCRLAWDAVGSPGFTQYCVYGRRDDQSFFQPLTNTLNTEFNTGHAWVHGTNDIRWYYAVVAVATNGMASPSLDTVENYLPTLAQFSADIVRGTLPLAVMFTNQSSGAITNWAWDFDGNGSIDSTLENPTAVYAVPGNYSVALTVSGPDGRDKRVAVGYIQVSQPNLQSIRIQPDLTSELNLSGQPGRNYLIQASTDLIGWETLTNLVTTNAITLLKDMSATNYPQRFYKAVVP